MKKLSPKDVIISEFFLMSSRTSPRQLFRVHNDQYVITLLDRDTETFGFESEIFTQVLNDLGGGIEDVTLKQAIAPERMEDGDTPCFEIRLHLKGGEIVSVDSRDEVHLLLPAAYGPSADETPVTPAVEIWEELPDIYPFSHLLVSEDMCKILHPLVGDSSPSDELNELWGAYQSATHDRCIKPPIPYRTRVQGEHFSFCVTEHICGKVTLSL